MRAGLPYKWIWWMISSESCTNHSATRRICFRISVRRKWKQRRSNTLHECYWWGQKCGVLGSEGQLFQQLPPRGRPVPQEQGGSSQPPQQLEGYKKQQSTTTNTTTMKDEVVVAQKDADSNGKNVKRVNAVVK